MDAVDAIVEPLAAAGMAVTDALIDSVRDLVMTAGSMAELKRGILDLQAKPAVNDHAALLGDAMLLADLSGRSEVLDGD